MGSRSKGLKHIVAASVAVASLAVVGALQSSTAGAATPTPSGSWPYPNGNVANTRVASGSTITSSNVAKLKEVWSFKLTGKGATDVFGSGSVTSSPIVVDGTVYIQDQECNVYALNVATGALRWKYTVNEPEKTGPGPNGVAVVGTRVYGQTPTAAFALDASTGKPIWIDRRLLGKGQGFFGIQPQVTNGRVYLASQYGLARGGGVLMALDASTGALLWKFKTAIGPDPGVKALGLGTGGAWETPLVGTDGSVTYGIGNPYQSVASAIDHPARQLYTDSDVNLTAATGKLRWYYQGVPNDFMDWDMQTSPMAASTRGVPVVIGSGKMGYVYEMNAKTGKLIWKTPVGKHDGNDNDGLLALDHKSKLKLPFTYEPGTVGGVLSNLALAGTTIYVVTDDIAFRFHSLTTVDGLPASSNPVAAGEVEALNLTTGKVEWDTKVQSFPLGAATVSNDLLFTTLYSGELLALNRTTGAVVYRHKLPTSTNAPIAIAGNTVIVPAGALQTSAKAKRGHPQVVAYRLP